MKRSLLTTLNRCRLEDSAHYLFDCIPTPLAQDDQRPDSGHTHSGAGVQVNATTHLSLTPTPERYIQGCSEGADCSEVPVGHPVATELRGSLDDGGKMVVRSGKPVVQHKRSANPASCFVNSSAPSLESPVKALLGNSARCNELLSNPVPLKGKLPWNVECSSTPLTQRSVG